MKKAWVLCYPLNAQPRLWSDWADAQAEMSLRCAHSHFVGFVMSRLTCSDDPQQKQHSGTVSNVTYCENFNRFYEYPNLAALASVLGVQKCEGVCRGAFKKSVMFLKSVVCSKNMMFLKSVVCFRSVVCSKSVVCSNSETGAINLQQLPSLPRQFQKFWFRIIPWYLISRIKLSLWSTAFTFDHIAILQDKQFKGETVGNFMCKILMYVTVTPINSCFVFLNCSL